MKLYDYIIAKYPPGTFRVSTGRRVKAGGFTFYLEKRYRGMWKVTEESTGGEALMSMNTLEGMIKTIKSPEFLARVRESIDTPHCKEMQKQMQEYINGLPEVIPREVPVPRGRAMKGEGK